MPRAPGRSAGQRRQPRSAAGTNPAPGPCGSPPSRPERPQPAALSHTWANPEERHKRPFARRTARGEHRRAQKREAALAPRRRAAGNFPSAPHRTASAGPPRDPPLSAPAPSLRAGPSSGRAAAAALPGGAQSLAQRARGHRGRERRRERETGTAPRPHLGHLRAQVDLLEVDGVAAQVVEQLAQQHAIAQRLRQVEDLGRLPGDPVVGRQHLAADQPLPALLPRLHPRHAAAAAAPAAPSAAAAAAGPARLAPLRPGPPRQAGPRRPLAGAQVRPRAAPCGSGCAQPLSARRVKQARGAGGGRCRSAAPAALLYHALPRAQLHFVRLLHHV